MWKEDGLHLCRPFADTPPLFAITTTDELARDRSGEISGKAPRWGLSTCTACGTSHAFGPSLGFLLRLRQWSAISVA